jgi:Protein of unknown function (DUF3592)
MYTKQPSTYDRRSAAGPGRQRYIGHLVVAGIGLAFLAATGLNMLLAGAGVIHDSSEPPGLKSVLLSFLWLAGAAVCLAVAIDAEHRLRGRGLPRGRVSYGPASARRGRRVTGVRRHGPVTTLITGVVFLIFTGVAVFGAVVAFSGAARSSYTQSNGVADDATVVNVSNVQDTSCARSSCSTTYTAQVTTTLSQPVSGDDATTINIPNNVSYTVGQVVPVLVDPQDPAYAELPGLPYATEGAAILIVLGGVFCLAIGALCTSSAVRMHRRLGAWRASQP